MYPASIFPPLPHRLDRTFSQRACFFDFVLHGSYPFRKKRKKNGPIQGGPRGGNFWNNLVKKRFVLPTYKVPVTCYLTYLTCYPRNSFAPSPQMPQTLKPFSFSSSPPIPSHFLGNATTREEKRKRKEKRTFLVDPTIHEEEGGKMLDDDDLTWHFQTGLPRIHTFYNTCRCTAPAHAHACAPSPPPLPSTNIIIIIIHQDQENEISQST